MTARPSPRVKFHPDPLHLETALAREIRNLRAASPWVPLLVVAPTARLVSRLRESLAAEFGALLGVEVLHYQALVYRVLESAGESAPPPMSRAVLEAVLAAVLEDGISRGKTTPLAAYAAQRPGALSEIVARIEELREAGIAPSALAAEDRGPVREFAALFADVEDALRALEADGMSDRAALVRRATALASPASPTSPTSPTYEAVFAYGAYEIVGMHLDLLAALRPPRGITFLIPGDLTAPAWSYARETVTRRMGVAPEPIPDPPSPRSFPEAARGLYRRERGREPGSPTGSPALSPGQVTLFHAPGPEAELNAAARRALRLVAAGVPPAHIAVIARTLEPYLSVGETVFERHGLPVDASGGLPLARHPMTRTLLHFLSALRDDFERRAVCELVRSPFLARPAWTEGAPARWRPEAWDRWSRAHGIVRGKDGWTRELPRLLREQPIPPWVEDDPAQTEAFHARREDEAASAEVLGRLVEAWDTLRREWERCASAAEHARFLRSLAATWIRGFGESATSLPECQALAGIWDRALEELRALERIRPGLSIHQVLPFLIRSLEEATLPRRHPSGISFLDAMQARGLFFPHVFLIGFNDGLLPRMPRENPLLPDDVRENLRKTTGRPLAVRREGREEERLLFANIVALTGERLVVSWSRAEAEGKTASVSLALRELARVLPGRPSFRDLLNGKAEASPLRIPAEPVAAARDLAGETPPLLLREEAALLAADGGAGRCDRLGAFLAGTDAEAARALAPNLEMAAAIDDDANASLAYDGAVPQDPEWNRPFSAHSLKRLGECPLTFFFERMLRIHPLDEETEEFRLRGRDVGDLVHRLLERVYREIAGHDSTGEALLARGREALERLWPSALEPIERRLGSRYPLLYRTTRDFWKREIEAFLAKDLTRLAAGGHRILGLEVRLSAVLPLGGTAKSGESAESAGLPVHGILDRLTQDREGRTWIADYKTAGRLETQLDLKEILRGDRFQIPLYIRLVQAGGAQAVSAELLGLGPEYFPEGGYARSDPPTLDTETLDAFDPGVVETWEVVAGLPRRGRFPFRDERHCGWCAYRLACRRTHFPSRTRVEEHPDHDTYFRLKWKTKKQPLLAGIPSTGDAEYDEYEEAGS